MHHEQHVTPEEFVQGVQSRQPLQRQVTRRGFLKEVGTVAAGAFLGGGQNPSRYPEASAHFESSPDSDTDGDVDPTLQIEAENPRELTFEEQKEFARRLYRNIDRMTALGLRRGIHDEGELFDVTENMEDYFGLVGVTSEYATAKTPVVQFVDYTDPEMHQHTAAQTVAMTELTVNSRYKDPEDPWYDNPDLIWIMAHEMAHMNGVIAPGREYTESSAQIAATAVLGAMANDGVSFAGREVYLYAFTDILRSMTMGSLLYKAIREGREMDYFEFKAEMIPGLDPVEAYDKNKEDWAENEEEHVAILDMYNDRPLQAILRGLQEGSVPPEDVFLPVNMDRVCAASYQCEGIEQKPDQSLPLNGVISMLNSLESRIASLENERIISGDSGEFRTSINPSLTSYHIADRYLKLPL